MDDQLDQCKHTLRRRGEWSEGRAILSIERPILRRRCRWREVVDLPISIGYHDRRREIHDGLGHALIAITLQLEKALVYQDKQPQEALQAVNDAKRVAKDALQDVRRSVSVLRSEREPFACTREIALLVEQLRENALSVDFAVDGSEERFSNDVLMTLYRVAQEGFTNIQKHAHASAVQVRLHFAEEEAHLSVCDNGHGFDPEQRPQQQSRDAGYGLQGIRERVALVGGSFQLTSQEGGGVRLLAIVKRTGIPTPWYGNLLQQSKQA